MATMYELTSDYNEVLELASNPDIDPQAITDTLEAINAEIEIKAENTAKVLRELEGMAAALKAEEQRLAARRKSIENNVDRIKTGLYEAMKTTGKTKFKTPLFSFAIAKNGGKIPIVVDVDTADLPDEFVTITEKPNVDAIREYLEKNGESPLAHFGERGESLRIK
jgi:hypothetical protein